MQITSLPQVLECFGGVFCGISGDYQGNFLLVDMDHKKKIENTGLIKSLSLCMCFSDSFFPPSIAPSVSTVNLPLPKVKIAHLHLC